MATQKKRKYATMKTIPIPARKYDLMDVETPVTLSVGRSAVAPYGTLTLPKHTRLYRGAHLDAKSCERNPFGSWFAGSVDVANMYARPKHLGQQGRICVYRPHHDITLAPTTPSNLVHWFKDLPVDAKTMDAIRVSFGFDPEAKRSLSCQDTYNTLSQTFGIKDPRTKPSLAQTAAGRCSWTNVDRMTLNALCQRWDQQRKENQRAPQGFINPRLRVQGGRFHHPEIGLCSSDSLLYADTETKILSVLTTFSSRALLRPVDEFTTINDVIKGVVPPRENPLDYRLRSQLPPSILVPNTALILDVIHDNKVKEHPQTGFIYVSLFYIFQSMKFTLVVREGKEHRVTQVPSKVVNITKPIKVIVDDAFATVKLPGKLENSWNIVISSQKYPWQRIQEEPLILFLKVNQPTLAVVF
jgi:hypothetical protein